MDNSFVLMTDSGCALPQTLAAEHDILCIPMHYMIDGKTYDDYLDKRQLAAHDFFEMLRSGKQATTSGINIAECEDAMEPCLKAGKDILCVNFSSKLSTTAQSFAIAAEGLKETYPDRTIITIDAKSASLGQGLLVYLTALEREKGKSIQAVAAFVEQTIPHLCHWFTVDDLMFLKRGGRISATTAVVGSMLQVKPVMHMDDPGYLVPVTKVRGRKASLQALAQKVIDEAINPETQTVFICNGDCEEDANYVADLIRAKITVKNILIGDVGTTIGAHTGPGVVSVFYVGEHR